MKDFNHIELLRKDLRSKGIHMTGFSWEYNHRNYDVLIENLENLSDRKSVYSTVLLTFILVDGSKDFLSLEANQAGFVNADVKVIREFFGIEYSPNLGNVMSQFFSNFLDSVPVEVPVKLNDSLKENILNVLCEREKMDANKIYCYSAVRLPEQNGKRKIRSIFISNITQLRRPDLFERFKDEPNVTFRYTSDQSKEKTTIEIIDNFVKNESGI